MKETITPTLSIQEAEFIHLSQVVKMTGLLILRRLYFFAYQVEDRVYASAPQQDLANHSGCSVSTVKRYLARMQEVGLLSIFSRQCNQYMVWTPNVYKLTPKAIHYLRLFNPQLNSKLPIRRKKEEETSSQEMSHGYEKIDELFETIERVVNGRPYEFARRVKNKGLTGAQQVLRLNRRQSLEQPLQFAYERDYNVRVGRRDRN